MKKKDIKVIVFDFDDTIYIGNIWAGWGDYVKTFFVQQYGKNKAQNLLDKYNIDNKTNGQTIAKAVICESGSSKPFRDYMEKYIYLLESDDLVHLSNEEFKRLKEKGYTLYIASNSQPTTIKFHLNKFGIDARNFKKICSNKFLKCDITKAKIYTEIMKKENCDPKNILVLGDSYQNDIVPAINLGINAIHVTSLEQTREIINSL